MWRRGAEPLHPAPDLVLKTETATPEEPIRGKRIYAALDPSYLEAIIGLRQMQVP